LSFSGVPKINKSKFADCSEIVAKGLSLLTTKSSLSQRVLEISFEDEIVMLFVAFSEESKETMLSKVNFAP
jgi:hypothetical protein